MSQNFSMMNRLLQWSRQVPFLVLAAISLTGAVFSVLASPSQAEQVSNLPAKSTSITLELADSSSISALADHLKKVGAKMYGAYWCPYCTRQMEMFGAAFRSIDYVECDPRGKNPRPNLCQAAKIKGYPTWEINGKFYPGVQSFEELAEASNYKGSRKF